MSNSGQRLESIRDALLGAASQALPIPDISIRLVKGRIVIDGELPSIAAKRHVLDRAESIPFIGPVVDRLRVAPARRMADSELRDELLKALIYEPAFSILAIQEKTRGRTELVRNPCKCSGVIEYEARDGVAILNGAVPGLGHKRLAGVLAWWVPGTRDVVNGISVMPEEEDSDEDILDAVRLVLDKDTRLDPLRIRVSVSDRVVTLSGHVPSQEAKERVERDAWYVLGVKDVLNLLSAEG